MTVTSGSVIQVASPVYKVEVVLRDADTDLHSKRHGIYEIIAESLTPILNSGLSISADELFSNAICRELADSDGRRTRRDLADRIPGLTGFVLRDLPSTGGALALTGQPGQGVVEYIGVGVGLTLIDRLFNLDGSYIRRIDQTSNSQILDFERTFRASIGAAYVQLETKGRTNSNNLNSAWVHIESKKRDFRAGKAQTRPIDAPLPPGTPTYLIGTVADIPLRKTGTTRIIFGDPPIPSFDGDPQRARLLQRLRFYQRVLSVFQRRGALLSALSERIGIIERAGPEWEVFDDQPLVNWRMEPWELSANISHTVRIRSNDQMHGRSVFPARSTPGSVGIPFFFVGLHRNVLLALARQDLHEIRDERYHIRHVQTEIDGVSRVLYQAPSGLIISSLQGERTETVN